MWNTFNMKEMRDYVYLYNMQNVLASLAVDIYIMKITSGKFNHNPLNFVTIASFS